MNRKRCFDKRLLLHFIVMEEMLTYHRLKPDQEILQGEPFTCNRYKEDLEISLIFSLRPIIDEQQQNPGSIPLSHRTMLKDS